MTRWSLCKHNPIAPSFNLYKINGVEARTGRLML